MPITRVSLPENYTAARRDSTEARAYPLGEADRPMRKNNTPAELRSVVRYLDVERSARYKQTPSSTYCNIYACDYCYLAGVFLPRVWWTDAALRDLRADKPVKPQYAQTVVEVDANGLYAWLQDFGASFGWRQRATLDELQQAANDGQVAVICARRKILSTPGHISVVVPESAAPQLAQRAGNTVVTPLQSQAGRRNFCFSCAPGRWWEGAQFAAYGFWTHP